METVNAQLLTELGFYLEKKKKDVKQCDIHLHYCKCLWKKSIDSSEVIVASLLGCGGMAYDN